MNHNRTFTTTARTVFVAAVFSLFWFGTQLATAFNCVPTDEILNTQFAPCDSLFKKETRRVIFPGATYIEEPEGSGQCNLGQSACCKPLKITECWPAFEQPVTTNGRWSMWVISKTASIFAQACGSECPLTQTALRCETSSTRLFLRDHTCPSGGSGGGSGECLQTGDCLNHSDCCSGVCSDGQCGDAQIGGSPVLVDMSGNGFSLTNALDGVKFDLNADGVREKLSWTAVDSDDAWLALDRNGNGKVDNGAELFGNFTPQPQVTEKNGFLALGEFDKPANGGNNDGVITQADAIFASLRLWQDANRNGISEAAELRDLNVSGIEMLELDYKLSQRADKYGNQFRYRGKLKDAHGSQLGRWAWDVFLLVDP